MNIGQVAQMTGLSAKQIRDYEKIGLLCVSRNAQSGYRHYSTSDIARLNFIAHAKAVGFSLKEIGSLLNLQDNPTRQSCQVKALTKRHIDELTDKITQLQAMQDTLQRWHDECSGKTGVDCPILQSLHQTK